MRGIVSSRVVLAWLITVTLLVVVGVDAAASPASVTPDCVGFTGQKAPKGPDGGSTVLDDVAPLGAADVWAVGHDGSTFRTLAEHWDGASWTVMSPPDPNRSNNAFNAVGAIPDANGDLWAVGYTSPAIDDLRTLAERWDATAGSWVVVPTPNHGPGSNTLIDVATPTSTQAWTVGWWRDGSAFRPLIEHWTQASGSWELEQGAPPISDSAVLLSVSAKSPDDVWAVGYENTGTGYAPLAEHYDGSGWIDVPTPPSGLGEDVLNAVTVVTPSEAWAVGYSYDGERYSTLTERWDGSTWKVVPSIDGGSGFSVLFGVAATTANDIWAVGSWAPDGTSNYQALSEHWDGAAWTLSPLPGVTSEKLNDVSPYVTGDGFVAVGNNAWVLTSPPCPSSGEPFQATTPGSSFARPSTEALPSVGVGADPVDDQSVLSAQPGGVATPVAVDEAASAGLQRTSIMWGAAVGDVNGDGWPDVFIGKHGNGGNLYVNQGTGRFTEIDQGTFSGKADRHGCSWLDANQDGRPDLSCVIGNDHGVGMKASELWIQLPDGSFADQGVVFGVADPFGRGRENVPIDVNHDGFVDLFVVNEPQRPDGLPSPNRLYLNEGGAAFRDVPAFGVDSEAGGFCAQAADYDGDGWQDLLVCPSTGGLRLYHNDGGSGFTDVSSLVGIGSDINVQDAILADLNGDSQLDLVEITRAKVRVRLQQGSTFTSVFTYKLKAGTWGSVGDVNGDGRPDIYVLTSTLSNANPPDILLLNNGDGTRFTSLGIPQATVGSGQQVTTIDFDRNGYSDFIVLNGGSHSAGPLQLISFFPEADAPVLSIGSGPTGPTNVTSAQLSFSADEQNVAFTCSFDGEAPQPCTSPVTYGGLLDGIHTFDVTGADVLGGQGSATWTWTVDTTPPVLTVTGGPPTDPTNQTEVSFTLTSSEPSGRTDCTLDGAPPQPCTSPIAYSGLADGPHTFTAVAYDAAGNGSQPVTVSWTVDTASFVIFN